MKITVENLKKLKVCAEAAQLGGKHKALSNGGMTPAAFLRAIPRGDWLIWWLWNSKQATIDQCILLGCVAARRSLRFAREQDMEILTVAIEAAEAVADNNTAQNRSAAWSAARSAARSAWSAAKSESAESAAAWSARSPSLVASSAAASKAAPAAAASSTSWSASWPAAAAAAAAGSSASASLKVWLAASESASAAWSAEHKAAADVCRKLMRTKRYRLIGRKQDGGAK